MTDLERLSGLKDCPFCGNPGMVIDCPEASNQGAVVVECQGCGANGPVVFGIKADPIPHAKEVWNKRFTH
jgi:Lar family restriction alleviation protein